MQKWEYGTLSVFIEQNAGIKRMSGNNEYWFNGKLIKKSNWEYNLKDKNGSIILLASDVAVLDFLGNEGWELVTNIPNQWVFKRSIE